MDNVPTSQITQLLDAVGEGDVDAHERLWKLIYDELHRLAQHQMAHEAPGRTLQPTALVHEAYLRLFGSDDIKWENRRHFFAAAAKSMRHIRIDYARKRVSLKRGGNRSAVPLFEDQAVFDENPSEVLAIDEALERLKERNELQADIVQLRYFAGMTIDEAAEALEVSPRKVGLQWRLAKAWLHRELSKGDTTMADRSE